MKKRKFILIIGVTVLAIVGIYLKTYFKPKGILANCDVQIKNLQEKLKEIDNKIQTFFTERDKQKPKYIFLYPPEALNNSLSDRFIIQETMATLFKQKGDYYFNELFFQDRFAPEKFKQITSLRITQLKKMLQSSDLAEVKVANEYLKTKIETRMIALKNYQLACQSIEDNASELYAVKKEAKTITVTPLRMVSSNDELSQALFNDEKIRSEYLSQRVKAGVHHKMGQCYQELGTFYGYSGLKNEYIKKYLDMSEKEFLISYGVDRGYASVYYDLAELYVARYEYFNDQNSIYLLSKGLYLLKRLGDPFSSKAVGQRNRKVLFLMGRIYYLMASLTQEELKNLGKIEGAVLSRLERLEKARYIYKDCLIGTVTEETSYYRNAMDNYEQIEIEIEREKRMR